MLSDLIQTSYQIRKSILDMCIKAGTGHVTSSMSCVEILVALYFGGVMRHDCKRPDWDGRDRLFVSKGQCSPAIYATLAKAHYFDEKDLSNFAQKGGKFGVHLQKSVPGVEITSGSLGHGFGCAVGNSLADTLDGRLSLTFALLGDGECYEGSIWEAAMFAAHNRLNNLVAIIDRNHLCVTGFTENVLALEDFGKKWESFGWIVLRVDGHNFVQLLSAFAHVRERGWQKPCVIIADTVKGKGIEFMENVPLWHGLAPKGEDADTARRILE